MDLRDLFGALQNQLLASLRANPQTIPHPSAQGDASELDWITMLAMYLPTRYKVSKAFVIDSDGAMSQQIDVVIYDRQYTPLMFERAQQLYVPAESVYAVFEVKPTFNRAHLLYAAEKAASVRHLNRTSAAIPFAAGQYEPRPLFTQLAGLLATESDWHPPCGDPFKTALSELPTDGRIDLGCALADASFEASYVHDAFTISEASQANALIFFFLALVRRLQALGTVPAIDIAAYARVLEGS